VIDKSEAAIAGDRSTVEFAHQQLARDDALGQDRIWHEPRDGSRRSPIPAKVKPP